MYRNGSLRVRQLLTAGSALAVLPARRRKVFARGIFAAARVLPRLVAGVVLLAAAVLKAQHLLVGGGVSDSSGMPPRFAWIVVSVELVLGLCLALGMRQRWSRAAALTLFSAFAVYSFRALLEGRPSCGCFGQVVTSPRVMLIVDLVVLALLFWWVPASERAEAGPCETDSSSPTRHRRSTISQTAFVLVPCLTFGLPAGWMASQFSQQSHVAPGGIVVLEPEQWLGNEFAIAPQINIGHELLEGQWIVLLYHHDCPMCQEAVAQYERQASQGDLSATRIAFVEIPPWNPYPRTSTGACRYGRLDQSHDWFVETPMHLLLSNGKVQEVSRDTLESGVPQHVTQVKR